MGSSHDRASPWEKVRPSLGPPQPDPRGLRELPRDVQLTALYGNGVGRPLGAPLVDREPGPADLDALPKPGRPSGGIVEDNASCANPLGGLPDVFRSAVTRVEPRPRLDRPSPVVDIVRPGPGAGDYGGPVGRGYRGMGDEAVLGEYSFLDQLGGGGHVARLCVALYVLDGGSVKPDEDRPPPSSLPPSIFGSPSSPPPNLGVYHVRRPHPLQHAYQVLRRKPRHLLEALLGVGAYV